MNYRLLDPASAELHEAIEFYEQRRERLGLEFLADVTAAIETIMEAPTRWAKISKQIRKYRLDRFPYGMLYSIDGDEVVIVAVAHLSRRSGYWRRRNAKGRQQ